MERFQLIIKNVETGETLVDIYSDAIIGATNHGPKGTRNICLTACNTCDLAATAAGAMQMANKALATLPKSLARLVRKIGKRNPDEHR